MFTELTVTIFNTKIIFHQFLLLIFIRDRHLVNQSGYFRQTVTGEKGKVFDIEKLTQKERI